MPHKKISLSEYISRLQEIHSEYPNAAVIYSSDDEGNSFNTVYYPPTVGNFTKDGDFHTDVTKSKINAVCIN